MDGEEILEWSPSGATQFRKPLAYINEPSVSLIQIKTTTVNMVVSSGHTIPYITSKGHFQTKPASEFIKLHATLIPRMYKAPELVGLAITDAELRVLIMQSADGNVRKVKKFTIGINVKKDRKKVRVIQLLEDANIPYVINKGAPGYLRVVYRPPECISVKGLQMLWGCNHRQLRVAYDELLLWDGCVSTRTFSGNAADSDVFQHVFSTISGHYTNQSKDRRTYVYGPIYSTIEAAKGVSLIRLNPIESWRPNPVSTFTPVDGRQYCFTTSTGFWLAKRGGKVFPTGNSGKSVYLGALLAELGVKTLILAHMSSLVEQLYQEIQNNTTANVVLLDDKSSELGDITIATSQLISKRPALWEQIKHNVGCIVVDEAETLMSLTTLRIIQRAHAKYHIFLSATFSRPVDKRTEGLRDFSGSAKFTLEKPNLTIPKIMMVNCPEVFPQFLNKNTYVRNKMKFFRLPSILEKTIFLTEASLKKGRQVLVACDVIELQESVYAALEGVGVLNGTTSKKERKRILEEFDSGVLKVLVAGAVVNAGLSIPKITTIVRVSFPSSETKSVQLVGRGQRGTECYVFDLVFTGQNPRARVRAFKENGYVVTTHSWKQIEENL